MGFICLFKNIAIFVFKLKKLPFRGSQFALSGSLYRLAVKEANYFAFYVLE